MSKKHQPQKGQNQKHKIEHVDQQNEPYLRTLHKRVRNLNKKLTEIAQLENKGNLKPEQIEKINRKKAVQEEIAKIQQNAQSFRDVYQENVNHYRNNQLKELEVLARALAIHHSGVAHPEQPKLAALWNALEQNDTNYPSLNQAISSIGNALKDFANDRKLQKSLNTYVQENGEKEFRNVVNQEKIVNELVDDIVPPVPQPKVQEPVKAQPPPSPPAPQPQPEPVEEKKPEPVEEKKVEKAPEVIVQKEPTPIAEQPKEDAKPVESNIKAEEKKEGDHPRRENRERPYKGKGGYKGGRRDRPEGERNEERRQYKPKYQEKKVQGERQRSSSSSSDSSVQARQFKKEEISKLQQEGFTVVGKPKPKPKDPKERRDFHDRQHGKKHHHHGRPQNY